MSIHFNPQPGNHIKDDRSSKNWEALIRCMTILSGTRKLKHHKCFQFKVDSGTNPTTRKWSIPASKNHSRRKLPIQHLEVIKYYDVSWKEKKRKGAAAAANGHSLIVSTKSISFKMQEQASATHLPLWLQPKIEIRERMRKQVEGQKQAESEIGGRNYLYPCNGRFPPRQPWRRRPVQTVSEAWKEGNRRGGKGRKEGVEWIQFRSWGSRRRCG